MPTPPRDRRKLQGQLEAAGQAIAQHPEFVEEAEVAWRLLREEVDAERFERTGKIVATADPVLLASKQGASLQTVTIGLQQLADRGRLRLIGRREESLLDFQLFPWPLEDKELPSEPRPVSPGAERASRSSAGSSQRPMAE